MNAGMESRRLEGEQSNRRKAVALTSVIFIAVLILCFFLTAFTMSIPSPGEQFVAVGFSDLGDTEQASGENESETPLVWKIMRSNFASFFLSYYTPKFFAIQGLRSSVFDANLATRELSDQFHDLVLLEGSREAILSRFSSF